jgi:hypothetical protein
MSHTLMENRSGLIVATVLMKASRIAGAQRRGEEISCAIRPAPAA